MIYQLCDSLARNGGIESIEDSLPAAAMSFMRRGAGRRYLSAS